MKISKNIARIIFMALTTSGLLQAFPAFDPIVVNKTNEKAIAGIFYNDQETKLRDTSDGVANVIAIEPGMSKKIPNLPSKSGYDRDLVIGFDSIKRETFGDYIRGKLEIDKPRFKNALSLTNVGTSKFVTKVTIDSQSRLGQPVVSIG